ncbi:ankyrin repeat-containing domain protein [Xylaria telfairii]|nr:ankyrin repeat-containing domain protein [Xylaria telfairii]
MNKSNTEASDLIESIQDNSKMFSTRSNSLDYTLNPSLMSDYEFAHHVIAAIHLDNQKHLEIMAIDSNRHRILRLEDDISGCDLVLCAVRLGSLKATETLLQLGISNKLHDDGIMNPILSCCEDHQITMLRLLLNHGASLSARDKSGGTIWHRAARSNSVIILEELAIQCPNLSRALEQRDFDKKTPLSIAIESAHLDATMFILQLFKQTGTCDHSPDLFIKALPINSAILIRALLTVGIRPEENPNSGSTVFHCLPPNISLECVQLIKSFYPDPCKCQKNGKVPLEIFLRNVLKMGKVDLDVVKELTTESYVWYTAAGGTMPWTFFCSEILPTYLVDNTFKVMGKLLADIGQVFLTVGAMASFEVAMRASGFSCLIYSLQACSLQPHWGRFWPFVANALTSSSYEPENDDPSLTVALAWSVRFGTPELSSKLLEAGASTHLKNTDLSPIILACQAGVPCGIDHVRLLLQYTTPEQLNDAGLIHLLCNSAILDLNEKLLAVIKNGADCSQDTAIALIKAGAQPNISKNGWTSISRATYGGFVQFLGQVETLSAHTIIWETYCSVDVSFLERRINSCNPLHLAAITGNAECVDVLCSTALSEKINSQAEGGFTPLFFAVLCGAHEVIKRLCRYGADPNIRTHSGAHVLHAAVRENSLEMVSILLQYNAKECLDPTFKTPSQLAALLGRKEVALKLASTACQTPPPCFDTLTELSSRLEKAIISRDLQLCIELRRGGASLDLPIPACAVCTPLALALYHRSIAIVEWLLQENASSGGSACALHTRSNLPPETTVQLAAQDSTWNFLLDRLLAKTLEDGLRWTFDTVHFSSLAAAIRHGNYPGAEIILCSLKKCADTYSTRPQDGGPKAQHQNLHYFDINKENFLHYGASIGDLQTIDFLLANGACLDALDDAGQVPLHMAIQNGNLETIGALLNLGSRSDTQDAMGKTPLMYGLEAQDLPVIQVLLQRDVNFASLDWRQRNVLHFIAETDNLTIGIFSLLVSKGVDPLSADVDGFCPLHFLLLNNHGRIRTALLRRTQRLYHPHSPNPRLHTTCTSKAMYLLDLPRIAQKPRFRGSFRTALKLRRQHRRSLLCEAAYQGLVSVVEMLLSCSVDVEFEGSPEGTALLAACTNGALDTVKCLVRHGAKLSYTDTVSNQYRSAVTAAAAHPDVLQWIMVGRFYDQLYLADKSFWGPQMEKARSKPVPIHAILKARMKRLKRESSLDYCVHLDSIRKAASTTKLGSSDWYLCY